MYRSEVPKSLAFPGCNSYQSLCDSYELRAVEPGTPARDRDLSGGMLCLSYSHIEGLIMDDSDYSDYSNDSISDLSSTPAPDYSWVPWMLLVSALVGLVIAYFIIKAAVRNGINESRLFVKPKEPEIIPDTVEQSEATKPSEPEAAKDDQPKPNAEQVNIRPEQVTRG
jgi:hypothetical protein